MKYKTYNEWKADGYQVLKNSKATWVHNKPKFHEGQVIYLPPELDYSSFYPLFGGEELSV